MSLASISAPELPRTNQGKRICQVIKVKPEHLDEYKKVHASVWPEVLGALRKAHIVDYSIHYLAEEKLLIAHMRYIGKPEDFEKDMDGIKQSEQTRKWWAMTDGMQTSYIPGAIGSENGPGWWTNTEEVFRFEG